MLSTKPLEPPVARAFLQRLRKQAKETGDPRLDAGNAAYRRCYKTKPVSALVLIYALVERARDRSLPALPHETVRAAFRDLYEIYEIELAVRGLEPQEKKTAALPW